MNSSLSATDVYRCAAYPSGSRKSFCAGRGLRTIFICMKNGAKNGKTPKKDTFIDITHLRRYYIYIEIPALKSGGSGKNKRHGKEPFYAEEKE
jgi:hypothetical protein